MSDKVLRLCVPVLLVLVGCSATGCILQFVVPPPAEDIALKSTHDKYLIALDGEGGWMLTQEEEWNACGRFTQRYLANGKVTLRTCFGLYVVAPETGNVRRDWLLGQASKPGRCGQFERYELGNGQVAYRTCADKFVTAGNDTWDPQWSVVAETQVLDHWERLDCEKR